MKTPADVTADITRWLANTWHTDVLGQTTSWPHQFSLGGVPSAVLSSEFPMVQRWVHDWHAWSSDQGTEIASANRRVHTTLQPIPTHVTVPDLRSAATIAGPDWVTRLERGAVRATVLSARFPTLPDPAGVLRTADSYTDTDFALLCDAAEWFESHDASGLTPRQVPIEGFHAKWLNNHQSLIQILAGRETLGMLPRHPARIHFTYLDPEHRAAGGRWHDSVTVGDRFTPAYEPTVVVISENKDTAIHFPATPGGIAVEGGGYGGAATAAIPWILAAPRLYYWGDMDAHGYTILNGFRAAGLAATSILMGPDIFMRYSRYGTNTDHQGRPILAGVRRALPRLTVEERTVYDWITDPGWDGFRRIEQERIPLHHAQEALSE